MPGKWLQQSIWIRLIILIFIFIMACCWLLFLVNKIEHGIHQHQEYQMPFQQKVSDNHIDSDDDRGSRHKRQDDTMVPENDENQKSRSSKLSFPSNLEQLKSLSKLLKQFENDEPNMVLLLFCSAYLFKQTFAIPGSVFMNLLAGAIYGILLGFPLCCLLTAIGATFCYLLSMMTGKLFLEKYFPEKLSMIRRRIFNEEQNSTAEDQKHQSTNRRNLFMILLSLRLFPMTPNWFLNMASPVVNVPIWLFFPSVLIGLMPYNYICVQTGAMLSQITSLDDVFTMKTFITMMAIAITMLVPQFLFKNKKAFINHNNLNHNNNQKEN